MKYNVQMGSSVMISKPIFMKIRADIQTLMAGEWGTENSTDSMVIS
jgi:hypothetical protein